MDILVLSPCSKDKRFEAVLDCRCVDEHSREELVRENQEHVTTAAEMYTGREHHHIKTGVGYLREVANVDWYIISAGFGLLGDETKIPSYECGFSDIASIRTRAKRAGYDINDLTNDETIRTVGREKDIPQALSRVLIQEYHLLFVILSEPYLLSVADALLEIPEQTTGFAFASEGSRQYVGDCIWIPATEVERRALETTWMALRGKQFSALAVTMTKQELNKIRESGEIGQEFYT